jgi:hypothetical protein
MTLKRLRTSPPIVPNQSATIFIFAIESKSGKAVIALSQENLPNQRLLTFAFLPIISPLNPLLK